MKNVNNSKDKEIWKEISGFEGEYAISSKGRVKNLKTGRILVANDNGAGYRRITLKGKHYSIHRLVALAFIPNPDNLPQVNHIDERKDNNDVSNLEWCSKSYNVNYSSHKQSCKIKQLDKDGNLIRTWDSFHQIERELGYVRPPIIRVCKCKQRSAYNFRWEYMDLSSQKIMNRPIIAYKGSEYIGTFASAKKASEALDLKYINIIHCLRGRQASTKGYTFSYK